MSKTYRVLVFPASTNDCKVVEINKDNSLKELQQLVKGYIQAIDIKITKENDKFNTLFVYINEDGLLMNLPVNKNLSFKKVSKRIFIGDIILCRNIYGYNEEDNEENIGLTDDDILLYLNK